MKSKIMLLVLGIMLTFGAVAYAAVDVVQAPSGYFLPSNTYVYEYPYYRWNGEDWSWKHGAMGSSFSTANLYVSAFDVDWQQGEVDNIYAKDNGSWVLLGSLTGTNDAWDYGNYFTLTSNFFDEIATGLEVKIQIDANDDGWAVTLGKSVITTDGSTPPPPNPTPEPATMLLLGLGLVGVVGLRKKM